MKIAIIGYGVEGKALANYFDNGKNEITVCDLKEHKFENKKIHTQFGPDYLGNLEKYDLIFRSPGIPYLKKEFNKVRGKLTSLTRYFFEKCPAKIVGVTGTKGKGTTSTLIYEMLKEGYKGGHVFLGGNIGKPPLEFLDELTAKDVVVLELSSFQLQDLDQGPDIAVVLGITADHLDHHKDLAEYIEAKKNIVKFLKPSSVAIFDQDNEVSANFAKATKAKKKFVSLHETVKEGAFMKVNSFVLKDGNTGMIFGEKGYTNLLGEHNIKNIMMAAVAAHELKVPLEVISKVVREFKPLPHRLEFIKETGGVKFYNDSLSTNQDTTVAAIKSFTSPLILIVGGSDKNLPFDTLGEEIAKHINIKTVVLMGETKPKIERAIEQAVAKAEKNIAERGAKSKGGIRRRDVPLELISAETYQEAFMVSRLIAEPGDVVLLSPGCASFDMFTDYKERGEIFRNFVLDT